MSLHFTYKQSYCFINTSEGYADNITVYYRKVILWVNDNAWQWQKAKIFLIFKFIHIFIIVIIKYEKHKQVEIDLVML